ncbi:acetyltransferase [Facklamia sp. DSM 111018]|uniref:Acetyltransferase n=1 Tax=Facklamia lactis TaxID=2749967 RepID=A0ABS0LN21_9LACT|nr:acetyltransferase [Facklamia lactis]MBG9979943.1 acetyltransferase [Facklamia lactis]MBG9985377.1 acetyltransferase [Facklamia lactis]
MNRQLIILGAGGHAKVCYEIALSMAQWEEILFLDDNPNNRYFSISGPIGSLSNYPTADFFIGIGNNEYRKILTQQLLKLEYSLVKLIHPSAIISSTVTIGVGTVVMAGAVINSCTKIGKSCIINTSSSIDHDNFIGDYSHISPGSHVAGNVSIGELVWVGIGSVISNNITLTDGVKLGAGFIAYQDINQSGTYVNNTKYRIL